MKLNVNLLAFAASASAISVQLVQNYCLEDVYLTVAVNVTEKRIGPFTLPSGQAYINNITGLGHESIVTNDPNVFGDTTGKLVLGSSTADEVLYW